MENLNELLLMKNKDMVILERLMSDRKYNLIDYSFIKQEDGYRIPKEKISALKETTILLNENLNFIINNIDFFEKFDEYEKFAETNDMFYITKIDIYSYKLIKWQDLYYLIEIYQGKNSGSYKSEYKSKYRGKVYELSKNGDKKIVDKDVVSVVKDDLTYFFNMSESKLLKSSLYTVHDKTNTNTIRHHYFEDGSYLKKENFNYKEIESSIENPFKLLKTPFYYDKNDKILAEIYLIKIGLSTYNIINYKENSKIVEIIRNETHKKMELSVFFSSFLSDTLNDGILEKEKRLNQRDNIVKNGKIIQSIVKTIAEDNFAGKIFQTGHLHSFYKIDEKLIEDEEFLLEQYELKFGK